MRILIINSEYPPVGGGAGNASANLARCFAASGHAVAVLTARFDNLPLLEENRGVSVHRIAGSRRRPDRSGAFEQLSFIASAWYRSSGVVNRFRPKVVLAFFGVPSGAVAWALKRRYQIPYVISLRGGDVPGFRPYDFRLYHKMVGPLLHKIWKDASAVVANSKGLQQLAHTFDSKVRFAIIPNGVEIADYEVGQRAWSPAHLLSVGRIVYQKGMDLGMEALAGLEDLEWEWSIVGDGPLAPVLQERARLLGLENRVHFRGWLSREQLPAAYRRSNLFLFPSRHEGMPNALLEAMASGLPAVATRIAGNDELILDGITGKLVNPEDPGALQSALRELIPDEKLRREMGEAARARAANDYSWERAAEQYLDLLSTALVSS